MSKIEQIVAAMKECFTDVADDRDPFNLVHVLGVMVSAYSKRTNVIQEVGNKIGREIGDVAMELKNIATALQRR